MAEIGSEPFSARPRRLRGVRQLDLLAQASWCLQASLDPGVSLELLAQLLVPKLADLCVVDLRTAGAAGGSTVACVERGVAVRLHQLRERFPVDLGSPHPVAQSLRSGRPVVVERFSDADYVAISQSPDHLQLMREVRYASAVVVPLQPLHEQPVGTLSVIRFAGRLPFSEQERQLTLELGRRASRAVEHGTLFHRAGAGRRLFEAAFDLLSRGITILDERGLRVYANPAAAHLLKAPSVRALCQAEPKWLAEPPLATDLRGRPLAPDRFPPRIALRGSEAAALLLCAERPLLLEARPLTVDGSRYALCELAAAPAPVGNL